MSAPAASPHPFAAIASHGNPAHPNILLLATGSVATIKLPLLVSQLLRHPLNVQLILTPTAERFLSKPEIAALSSQVRVWRNDDEWARPWKRGDPVLHIELRKWADLLLVAPLSANSLGAITAGLCGGLGLSVVRAWDTEGVMRARGEGVDGRVEGEEKKDEKGSENSARRRRKLILVAPAMNTQMYLHPLTAQQLQVLEGWGWVEVLRPVEKALACGDVGVGGMVEVPDIVDAVLERLLS